MSFRALFARAPTLSRRAVTAVTPSTSSSALTSSASSLFTRNNTRNLLPLSLSHSSAGLLSTSAAAAAAAAPEPAVIDDAVPTKWSAVLPYSAVAYESDVPATVWEVGTRSYALFHTINRVTELLSDPDTANLPETRARIAALVAPFDPTLADKPMVDLQREMGRL